METIKSVAKYMLIPLLFLLGLLYSLTRQVDRLKQRLAAQDAEKQLGEVMAKIDEAKKDADAQETEYRRQLADLHNRLDKYRTGKLPDDAE